MSPAAADPPGSDRAIENLIAAYAELVDDGNFTRLGALLAEATFTGGGHPVPQDALGVAVGGPLALGVAERGLRLLPH